MNDYIFVKKRLLTAKEAAEYLGIAIGSIYNLINQKLLPYVSKPNSERLWRIDIRDLNNWIDNNKIESIVNSEL